MVCRTSSSSDTEGSDNEIPPTGNGENDSVEFSVEDINDCEGSADDSAPDEE